jgi:hypothetical protein
VSSCGTSRGARDSRVNAEKPEQNQRPRIDRVRDPLRILRGIALALG